MAVYYVFDLDGTLTNQYSYFYFLSDFKPRGVYRAEDDTEHTPYLNTTHQDILDTAYTQFVNLVAVKESSETPLGLLRPGILPVCREILRQQKEGLCISALMYSNNPNPMVLEFVRDVIHKILGAPIFCTLADWTHPLRTSEITPGQPGAAEKTWDTLHQIIMKECGGQQVTPRQVMFIDDQHHPNLEDVLPSGNYIRVSPYTFKSSIDSIKPLYIQAMKHVKGSRAVLHYVHSNSGNEISTLENHIVQIKNDSPQAAAFGTLAPLPDASVRKLLSAVSIFPEQSKLRGGGGGGGSQKKNHKTRRNRVSHYTSPTYTQKRRRSDLSIQKKIRHRR
jgi:hypothetical protein